ncbi:MAG: hypothetical protein JOZ83_17770 [Silvibacterium sp.]|nr:hypothetical protein [Silvibacterium sp.]
MAENPQHGPTSSEPQNEVMEPAAEVPAGELNASAEEQPHEAGSARAAARVITSNSGASTHPTG